jgi:hypothetical protein
MNQVWIVIVVGVILPVDLLATQLRKRARHMTVPPKPLSEEEESHGSTEGEITVQTE